MADISKEQAVQLAREAGFDLNGMQNMLYTVRGNHAQLGRLIKLARNQALEDALHSYSPDDTASSYLEKLESLKDNTP